MTAASITRLHISPLNPDLLHAILHPSAREAATDISYHTVQTFPENSYGFVNLPKMEAEKVTKKLNGAILKGKKLRIQEARPSKRPAPDTDAPAADSTPPQPKPEKATKKRKSSDNVVDGYDLPSDRHVKRGWTDPGHKDKRSRKTDKKEEKKRTSQKSKYTEKAECLFRTTVPSNKIDLEKEKKKSGEKKKKDKKAPGATVVHEFENSVTVPSFLRSGDDASAAGFTNEFVEGKGWVDREGNVKEPPPPPAKTRIDKEKVHAKGKAKQLEKTKGGIDTAKPATKKLADTSSSSEVDDDETSSSGSSDSSSDEEIEDVTSSSGSDDEDEDTSSDSSSDDDSSSSSDEEEENEKTDNETTPRAKNPTTQPTPSITVTPSKPQADVANEANEPTEIHPLEALFKRPAATKPRRDSTSGQKRPLEINTQFSFFSADNNDDDIEEEDESTHLQHNTLNVPEPQTPFTKQDLLTRVVRSAAPTPDTAAPHKGRFWDHDDDDDRMDLDDDGYYGDGDVTFNGAETPSKAATAGKGPSKKEKEEEAESDFSKWFWENRGDNNRAWKRRRREAAKEKRQRENRSKGFRGK
ncbi:hypothetical protein FQN51_006172 [Onygenales sp. PD_10]|nr:hypothetical protein FQN51_006172 [Onygenales sp. PD_10]